MRLDIAAAALALMLAHQVAAQADSITTWPVGARVRVWTSSDRPLVGYLKEPRGDTLIVEAPGASRSQTKVLAESAIRLEVSDGRMISPRNVVGGAFGGAALSIAAVAVVATIWNEEADCTVGGACITDPDYGDVALYGAAIGAVVGLLKLEDQWRRVRIPGRVGFGASPRHAAFTLSFAFR